MEHDEITHWLELPTGTAFVEFSKLSHLIAKALHPAESEDNDFDYAFARLNLDGELPAAVAAKILPVRDPLTHGPHRFPLGGALQTAIVKVTELQEFLADRGIGVWIADQPAATGPTPGADEAPQREDDSALATREQLIAAFGAFTGMNMAWFDKLQGTPALLKARKVAGVGARSKTREPLFCPWEVMLWLIDPKRKKGRPFHNIGKPWELLERRFPAAYVKHSKGDPREERTG